MPLEDLRRDIEKGAKAEAARINRETEEERGRILKEARDRADAIARDAAAGVEAEVQARRAAEAAGLELEARLAELSGRESALEREAKAIMSMLVRELRAKHRDELLKGALKSFAMIVPQEQTTLQLGRGYRDQPRGKYRIERLDGEGFRLLSADGKIALNGDIADLVGSYEPAIKSELAKAMFKPRARLAKAATATTAAPTGPKKRGRPRKSE